ncbi:MAG: FAD-dependent oxidoreductase [Pseudomonadota bacterium]
MTDPRYAVLFEPVEIGPVTAPNRFYQVPHCNVLGHMRPKAEAANRGVKAEGGWGVVCTQEVEIHPSSELTPFVEGRLWDDRDIPQHRLMTDAVHAHGALAGIELAYNGHHANNLYSRISPMAPSATIVHGNMPVHARGMTRADIKNVRRWHVAAAKRARRAGYDIVYVYAGHDMVTLMHFLKKSMNHRTDEYGGSLENRARLLHETLCDVKDAVGDTCGIALRFATDELLGEDGLRHESEGRDVVGLLAEIPDLWDVNVADWGNDSATARFEPAEGYQEKYTAFVKTLTSKPVVGVGRFTSPDAMVSQIKRGVLDLIGAARPSIADPFLPNKIREGRIEDIRECIGCNICVAQDNLSGPIRCTQNPTQGEEWKRRWHPERIEPAKTLEQVLIVGAGPAGLECALQLARRGHEVMLAEARNSLGGRSARESMLPGLSSYSRVADYRINQLQRLPNVQMFPGNALSAGDIVDLGIEHVFVATGSQWRRDGAGRFHHHAIDGIHSAHVLTPDDILNDNSPSGEVIIYDDDHYLMGGVIAEHLHNNGANITLVTTEPVVSSWTVNTLEQDKIQSKLMRMGIGIITSHCIATVNGANVDVASIYCADQITSLYADAIIMATSRVGETDLFDELSNHADQFSTLKQIGDCEVPGTIAAATYSGHHAARVFQSGAGEYDHLYAREIIQIELECQH